MRRCIQAPHCHVGETIRLDSVAQYGVKGDVGLHRAGAVLGGSTRLRSMLVCAVCHSRGMECRVFGFVQDGTKSKLIGRAGVGGGIEA